jgi:hypothetical protein
MTRRFHYLPVALALALAACGAAPQDPAAVRTPVEPLHGHATSPSTGLVTSIGEVRSIDSLANTITLALVRGSVSERSGLGRVERFRARLQLLDQARVGDVIEFKYRRGVPLSEIVAISRHHHGTPIGLPEEPPAR